MWGGGTNYAVIMHRYVHTLGRFNQYLDAVTIVDAILTRLVTAWASVHGGIQSLNATSRSLTHSLSLSIYSPGYHVVPITR